MICENYANHHYPNTLVQFFSNKLCMSQYMLTNKTHKFLPMYILLSQLLLTLKMLDT